MRFPQDAEPAGQGRGGLEELRPGLDAEPLRGLDELVEELLGVHGGWYPRGARR